MAFEGVGEVAAIGVPSELTEDDCLVVVAPREGTTLDPWDLVRHCVANMPFFAVPRYYVLVDELPKTPTGKVEKYRLREKGIPADVFDLEAEGYRVNRTGLVEFDAATGRTAGAG
jgi:crotonobetaine/carnitine-CoA ligase